MSFRDRGDRGERGDRGDRGERDYQSRGHNSSNGGHDEFSSRRRDETEQRRKKYIFKEGDWECPNSKCRNQNFAKRDVCNLCNALKPEKISKTSRSGSRGSRGSRGSPRRRKSRSRSRSRSDSRQLRKKYPGNNTNRNEPLVNSSFNNSNNRQANKFDNFKFKDGDWKCEKCNNVNFGWRTKCNRCREEKTGERNHRHERSDRHHKNERRSNSNNVNDRKKHHSRRNRSRSNSSLFSSKSKNSGNVIGNVNTRKRHEVENKYSQYHRKQHQHRDRSISRSLSPVKNKHDSTSSLVRRQSDSDSVHKIRFIEKESQRENEINNK